MNRRLFCFLLLVVAFCFSFTGKQADSLLYRADYRLRVDTTLKIGPLRYAKWMKVEDTIEKLLVKNIHYPDMNRENNITGHLIMSFDLDDSAKVSNVAIADDSSRIQRINLMLCARECALEIKTIAQFFPALNFKAQKGKKEKYFLPFYFDILRENKSLQAHAGYILIATQGIVPDDEPNVKPVHIERQQ